MERYLFYSGLIATSIAFTSLNALDDRPWLKNAYEFQFDASYVYSHFSRVDHAVQQYSKDFNNNLVSSGISFYLPQWAIGLDLDFIQTPLQPFSFRSGGGNARYLWLNDIQGDPISVAFGGSLRGISTRSVQDVSNPFHAQFEVAIDLTLGTEWSVGPDWRHRIYFYDALGMANRGYPFLKSKLGWDFNHSNTSQYGLSLMWYQGFGPEMTVDIYNFDGYARIRHLSLDGSFFYEYRFGLWGSLTATLTQRFFARSYPEYQTAVELRYTLPFSAF